MKQPDKLLIGIVAGIVTLVVAALLVVGLRPEPEYRTDDSPEGVVFNYLLALQREEYARAHGYLAPTLVHYPATVDDFVAGTTAFDRYLADQDEVTLQVVDTRGSEGTRIVTVVETRFYRSGPFDSSRYQSNFDVTLTWQDGQWWISDAERYFSSCWSNPDVRCR